MFWRNPPSRPKTSVITPGLQLTKVLEASRRSPPVLGGATFHSVPTDVRNRSAWEDTIVDGLCEALETFSFGGIMFAHMIMFNAYRRMVAIDLRRDLGAKVEGDGCPMEYLVSLAEPRTPNC
jgi:hypothetical protein